MTRTKRWSGLGGLGLAALVSACAGTPRPAPTVAQPSASFLAPARFTDLPGWANADLRPAVSALRQQCARWANLTPDQPIAAGARYGGAVRDWGPACAAAQTLAPGQERRFFEYYFTPSLVAPSGETKLTGYYEPVITASRTPAPGLTEPLLRRPNDMITIELSAFADATQNTALAQGPRTLIGKLSGDRVRPYPQRAEIAPVPDQVIGYAHPADVYNLQVQGSGRLGFLDGQQARAAYAAQNGYKWNSALQSAPQGNRTWAGFRAWLDSTGAQAHAMLNADPSYIFFAEEPIADPALGPRGAAGVNLTALGSMAVDPAYHPYGALLYVDGTFDGAPFERLLVAQDTGGAIRRGPLRGDVFFGSGPDAGAMAERMNGPARFWTLLPRTATPVAMLPGAPRS
ncbi:MAG: MltA domain-containing protein [Hyphomonadaceae bacterium]